MRHLYLKIYVGVVVTALLVMLGAMAVGRQLHDWERPSRPGAVLRERAPGPGPPAWRRGRPPRPGLVAVGLFALAIGIGAYPISRGITRRLERLGKAVDDWGEGELSSRVPVEGRDEVAELARSFNRAAERIEALFSAQRRLLASASHELRSPLTRLGLAVELLSRNGRDDLREEAERDIRELDELIDDLLLAARLQGGAAPARAEPVELGPLLAEEAERGGAACSGEAPALRGDARLLRRLARNLIENARRHGGGEVEVLLTPLPAPDGPGARIRVVDRGPGVPAEERERIFEPFYRPEGHSEGRDGGVGLGLALVREIARHHRGDARCLSREGGGSVFEVDLRGLP